MKALLLIAAALLPAIAAQAYDHRHASYEALLKKHVSKGLVDYKGLKTDAATLDSYIQTLAAVTKSEFKTWSRDERLAFLINLYNAITLDVILDHHPLKSIKDINGGSGPWKDKLVPLLGKTTSLDALENEVIRPDFKEPRIHFALVCAAVGCPPLRPGAFTAESLDAQLADQTKALLTQSSKNRRDGDTLYLSSIFDWYGKDFPGGRATWVAPWLGEGSRVKFTEYDWSLNQN